MFEQMSRNGIVKSVGDYIRVRVRERLSATPGNVIGQGPAPGGQIVPCGGSGGGGGDLKKLRVY